MFYTSTTHLQKEPDFVMYVYNTIQFCVESYSAPTCANWMMINFHLSQNIDCVAAGPYAVCFLTELIDLLSIQNIRPALGTSGLLFTGCCGSFPSIGAADDESDHLSLFSAEVTDQCSCNFGSAECHYDGHRNNCTSYHFFFFFLQYPPHFIMYVYNRIQFCV
jgi:hypothetical protein